MRKVIFLDRDGVINKEVGLLHKKEDAVILPNVQVALQKLKLSGFILIGITNQPTVARGLISEQGLIDLNNHINEKAGNHIQKFYFCPHHPNADLEQYRKACDCRKPAPGLIIQASNDLNLDLKNSWMIGDRSSDIAAGKSAGTKTILLDSEHSNKSIESSTPYDYNIKPDKQAKDLLDAANQILQGSNKIKKALILSAGLGTRMHPYTKEMPKVMLEMKGKPLLQYNIEALKNYGVEEICINLHHFPEKIKEFLGDGSNFGVKINYNYEQELLGTAGAIQEFKNILTEPFFLINGDVLGKINIEKWVNFHFLKNSDATLIVHPSSHPEDSDIINLDNDSKITNFFHKPGSSKFGILGNAGWAILSPKAFQFLPQGPSDLIKDLIPAMHRAGLNLYGFNTPEILMDVGTPERFDKFAKSFF